MESMKLFVPLLALGLSVGLSGGFAADAPPPNNLVEEIVAKCNGDIVTRGDLERARRELMETLRANGIVGEELERQLSEREKNLLRDRIDQLILTQKAKDLNISVDSDVTKQMAAIPRSPNPRNSRSTSRNRAGCRMKTSSRR
jgi:hypothetical protein